MPHVLIENGVVIALDLTGNPQEGYIECPDDVQPGFTYNGETYTPPVPEPAPVPSEISDRQFFQQMAHDGQITEQEALDAVGSGVIPAAMEALIEQLPAGQQFAARMLVRGATTFRRDHPVTALIGQLYGMTDEEIDDLWFEASKL